MVIYVDIDNTICSILDELEPLDNGVSYSNQIKFVKDRPGHDFRYALNSNKIKKKLKWKPKINLNQGISKTVDWYIKNQKYFKKLNEKNFSHRW